MRTGRNAPEMTIAIVVLGAFAGGLWLLVDVALIAATKLAALL